MAGWRSEWIEGPCSNSVMLNLFRATNVVVLENKKGGVPLDAALPVLPGGLKTSP